MLDLLRSATQDAHAALEDALDLLRTPLPRARFVSALHGFRAFHMRWEPRVAALTGERDWLGPRSKIALLEADLRALDEAPLAAGDPDVAFLDTPSAAWGSLYVMEGATLGGQVISKALRRAAWAPPGGLTYFNPYGPRTGFMWADFRSVLEGREADLDRSSVVRGARATFAALQTGLVSRLELAA